MQPPAPVELGLSDSGPARVHFWRGASGRRYVHSVYSLIECPPLPPSSYLLVKRDEAGHRTVLHVGEGRSDAATLNLAQVRQRGAALGANEVHVHFMAASPAQRQLALCDLRAGLLDELSAEPARRRSA